jgi:SAM-dependent methyltransferase
MKLQLLYVQNHNLWVDLKIIAYTLYRMARGSWVPPEIRHYSPPGCQSSSVANSFETVTELPGVPANAEQLAMLHTRYGWVGNLVEGKEVLEVACGSGIGLGHLAARAKRVVGGEYDAKLAAVAHRQYGGRIDVQHVDAHKLPFADASFDTVILLEAIYYLQHPERFIREAHRVLRPDGSLLVCSANCERPDFNASPFSSRYFSARSLRQLLEQNGFCAQLFAGFPTKIAGRKDRVRHVCRAAAVKLHLIPKTMKWKARWKRLFFGKLQSLPAALGPDLPEFELPVAIDAHQPVPNYMVLYAVGQRDAHVQLAAA